MERSCEDLILSILCLPGNSAKMYDLSWDGDEFTVTRTQKVGWFGWKSDLLRESGLNRIQ